MRNKKYIPLITIIILAGLFAISILFIKNVTLSGNVVDNQGYANLTVETSTQVNFTNRDISWGSGRVTTGQTTAVIDTYGNVVRGNWTPVTVGLVLANIGNGNVTIDVVAGTTNATFLGGSAPRYDWAFSNNLSGSCVSDLTLGAFYPVNDSIRACKQLGYLTNANTIEIDFNLTIPYNAIVGRRTDTITAIATAA